MSSAKEDSNTKDLSQQSKELYRAFRDALAPYNNDQANDAITLLHGHVKNIQDTVNALVGNRIEMRMEEVSRDPNTIRQAIYITMSDVLNNKKVIDTWMVTILTATVYPVTLEFGGTTHANATDANDMFTKMSQTALQPNGKLFRQILTLAFARGK